MCKRFKPYYSSLLILFLSPLGSAMNAIENGTADMDFRYRYETVDQDNIANTAHASTLRSRFNYTTAAQSGLQAQFEIGRLTTSRPYSLSRISAITSGFSRLTV